MHRSARRIYDGVISSATECVASDGSSNTIGGCSSRTLIDDPLHLLCLDQETWVKIRYINTDMFVLFKQNVAERSSLYNRYIYYRYSTFRKSLHWFDVYSAFVSGRLIFSNWQDFVNRKLAWDFWWNTLFGNITQLDTNKQKTRIHLT